MDWSRVKSAARGPAGGGRRVLTVAPAAERVEERVESGGEGGGPEGGPAHEYLLRRELRACGAG